MRRLNDTFLVKLADALRPLTDPVEVQATAARALGEYLRLSRVHYGETTDDGFVVVERDYTDGVMGIRGRFRMDGFGPGHIALLRAGRTLVVPDVAHCAELTEAERGAYAGVSVGAMVGVPLVKGGRLTAVLAAHQSAVREWTPEDVALIESVAERTWAAVEQARAESALRASEKVRLVALSAGRMGTWGWDLKGRTVSGDAAFAAMFNVPPGDRALPVEALQEKMAPEDAAKFEALMRAELAPGAEIEYTLRLDRVYGAPIWLAWRGRADAETPSYLVGVCFDVTARMRAEDALRESELRFELALTAAQMGVWTLDVATGVQVRDPNLNQLLGLAPAETTQPFPEFLDHVYVYDRAPVRAAFDASVHWGRGLSTEFRVVWPDGSVRWLRDRGDVFGDSRTGTRRMAGVCVDVTDLKDAEEALQRAHAGLETRVIERTTELASALESLGSEMARRVDLTRRLATAQEDERRRVARDLHDSVGQLLAGLSLAVKAVETAGELPPASAARLTEVQRMADALGREIHGLAVRLRPTSLDDIGLEPALEQLVAEWSGRCGIRADFHSTGLGPSRLPPDIETALYRVVQEALTNVARHALATTVSVVISRPDGYVTAVIEDDGAGFDPEAGPKGRLGLLGMRERVALAGGTMEVESAHGQGTTIIVRIRLPIEPH
ncbi:PAS domain-containing protein [Gemmata sp. G18]|uniref:histidine kinase n=1 Tax=Gemmata palustris TaxID=2822762 RepID=A0ABS5BMC1_9BACT|nr:PAS domain-containing protein [Gemmata palustris]MBP3954043.1 PAS domain-containing protein [Gemmata palustris]